MSEKIDSSVLITGANGFVGSRLCRLLQAEGFKVIAGVRRNANLSLLAGLTPEFRYGDITDPESLDSMVAGVDLVVHNAGVVKARKLETFFEVNENGTRNLFEAILRVNSSVKKVVYVSSVAVAGPVIQDRPVEESDEPNPISPYGESKLAGERVALSYNDRLKVIAVRPPAVYGPGDKEVFKFFQTVYRRIRPHIGDVERSIQMVHVDDLCRGIFLALTAEQASSGAYFIAEDRAYSLRELMLLMQKGSRRSALAVTIPAPLFRLIACVAEYSCRLLGVMPMLTRQKATEILLSWEISTAKARDELGYSSRIPFEQGARETYQWYFRQGWLK